MAPVLSGGASAPVARQRRRVHGCGRLVAAAAIGIGLGGRHPAAPGHPSGGALNWIANALSGWLLAAFLVGATMPYTAVGGGHLRGDAAGRARRLLPDRPGPVRLRHRERRRHRVGDGRAGRWLGVRGRRLVVAERWCLARAAAAGLLAALFVAEGVYFLVILPDRTVGAGAIVAGLVAPLLLGRAWGDRGLGLRLAMLPGLALGALGYAALLLVMRVITGVEAAGRARPSGCC